MPVEGWSTSTAIGAWLESTFDSEVVEAQPPVALAGGFDHEIYQVQYRGDRLPPEWLQPVVARVEPRDWRYPLLQRETQLQEWCVAHDYPTPRPLALLAPSELFDSAIQVIECAPGRRMDQAMGSRPWQVRALARLLARLAAKLHQLPVPPWAQPDQQEWSVLERRLTLVRYLVDLQPGSDLASGLQRIEQLAPRLRDAAPVICHGDLHPLNVLVEGPRAAVIDWTDAGVGDVHADIARTVLLFRLAAIAAPTAAERSMMRVVGPWLASIFLKEYQRQLPVDRARLRLWDPVHMLHNWAMVVADEQEISGPPTAGVRYRRGLGPILRRQFETAIAAIS